MRSHTEILRDITRFKPHDGVWLELDDLLSELWLAGQPPIDALPILFGVFEKFPEEDGAGVLWSIVHGVEALSYSYESLLRESHDRRPSEMSEVMLIRLNNSKGAG
jgi:hypothetical protein